MSKDSAESAHSAWPRPYPALDPAQTASLNAKLVEIAAVPHQDRLSEKQLADLAALAPPPQLVPPPPAI